MSEGTHWVGVDKSKKWRWLDFSESSVLFWGVNPEFTGKTVKWLHVARKDNDILRKGKSWGEKWIFGFLFHLSACGQW